MTKAKVVALPKIEDPRGNLSFLEGCKQIPFEIARCYWIYDVPGGEVRGGHAYRTNEEFVIALSGSFEVMVGPPGEAERIGLNRSYMGVHIPRGHWRELCNFSTNSLALIVASEPYSEADYVRDVLEYKALTAN